MNTRPKVGLLGIGGLHWIAGVNYVVNLMLALNNLPEEERAKVYLIELADSDLGLYDKAASRVQVIPWPGRNKRSIFARLFRRVDVRELQKMQALSVQKENISCVFPCKFRNGVQYGVPWIGWAVDFQHKYYPEFFTPSYVQERDDLFIWHGENSPLVVNSSQCAVEDFDRYYPGYRHKLRVLHFRTVPFPEWFTGDPEAVTRKYKLSPKFLMVPNQFFIHKNHECAFHALKALRDRGYDISLVCTGKTEDSRMPRFFQELLEYIESNGLKDHVRILGLLPRFEQIQIMRKAAAIVQPSFFEGWSTVVEDARAMGKPIFLSDIPVHREQAPPRAVYFDPRDPDALADAVSHAWNQLSPGPIVEEEMEATENHRQHIVNYARDFIQLVREVEEIAGK